MGDPDVPDALFEFMLDAADNLAAATFLAIHGYYGPAFGSLRSVLELTTVGCLIQSTGDKRAAEAGLGYACDPLPKQPRAATLQDLLVAKLGSGLFEQADSTRGIDAGLLRQLFKTLSKFAHSSPGHTSGSMWESNGQSTGPGLSVDLWRSSQMCWRVAIS